MDLVNGMQAVESLVEASAAVASQLDVLMQVESPIDMMSAGSDCCGSNNYPQEPN